MRRVIHTMSLICAAAAMLAVSTPTVAQTSTTKQPAPTVAQAPGPNAGQALMDARKALNAVLNAPAPNQQVFERLNEIKTHYLEVEKAYSSRGDWQAPYTAINQIISDLTDAGTATSAAPTSTATSGATGTSGITATANLDTQTINNLQAFRKALGDFSKAMGGAAPAAASSRPSATSGAIGTMGSPPSTSATATSSTGTSPPATVTEPSAAAPQATPTAADAHVSEIARLIAVALSSEATAAGADTVCVDRKTLQDIQTHIMQLQAIKKPQ